MSDYSLNCNGFSVRMGDVARPIANQGLPVRRVNWSDGEFLPREDRYFVDLDIERHAYADQFSEEERRICTIALDPANRPKTPRGYVYDFSVQAEILRKPLNLGNFDVPLYLARTVERPVGRAALLKIVDFCPYSYEMGAANIPEMGKAALLQECRVEFGALQAGVSALLMPEGTEIVLRQEYRSGTRDRDFGLRYNPDHFEKIHIEPKLGIDLDEPRYHEEDEPPDDPRGGSDREPRNPRAPLRSGAVELDPEPEEIVEAYLQQ